MKQPVIYKRFSIRLSDFSSETWEATKQWFNIFKCKTNKKCQEVDPVSSKTVLGKSKEEIKMSQYTKVGGFVTMGSAL